MLLYIIYLILFKNLIYLFLKYFYIKRDILQTFVSKDAIFAYNLLISKKIRG